MYKCQAQMAGLPSHFWEADLVLPDHALQFLHPWLMLFLEAGHSTSLRDSFLPF